MLQSVLKNFENKEISKLELNGSIFSQAERADILHRVINWQLSKRRSGCHKVKGRSEVAGTTKKIYRQKGTGQARHGAATAPIFVGGGVAFGPQLRSHGYSLNKKIRKLGLRIALSLKYAQNSIIFLDSVNLESNKTSSLKSKLDVLGVKSTLIIGDQFDENMRHAASNLKEVDLLSVNGLNVLDIIKHKNLIITKAALEEIEKRLSC
ncbi:MAG: 50S ribosomal protein L4 [Alphaproteobacteria bacterium]|jgi:large subunit ribosomal protein L4|nr:50S ribosomal protein L4 [Candidatus Jidaibacter sp.]